MTLTYNTCINSLTQLVSGHRLQYGRRRGLVVERRTPEREVGVRSSLRSLCCVLEQDTFTFQKVLVIPRKRWLRPAMTEKFLTGTLNLNKIKTKQAAIVEKSTFSKTKTYVSNLTLP